MKPDKAVLTKFCIQTGEGFYDYEEPDRSTVSLAEIAHSLHGIRRWNGQTTPYISVAQHVCLVSDQLALTGDYRAALYGLHHDDHEALRGDIPSPRKRYLKKHKMLFEGEETAEDTFIYGKLLDLEFPVPEEIEAKVKYYDLVSLVTEKRWLKPDTVTWPEGFPPIAGLEPLSKDEMFYYLDELSNWEEEYLARHENLKELLNA